MENKEWLSHLPNEVMKGARNNNLCSYVIALEGWRRGLELKYYSRAVKQGTLHAPGLLFSLSDGNNEKMFYKSRGDKVKREAFTIGGNKYKAKQILHENGIPVPLGKLFEQDASNDEILKFAKKIGFPVVLKPSNAAQGKGVISHIENDDFLMRAIIHVREELGYKEVILEEHAFGNEYRVYVMKDKVIAVLNRDPANIVGDGTSTIRQLINKKNKSRKRNPRLYSCLINVDFEVKNQLEKQNLSLESIPNKNEKVYLRTKSNITSGGDSLDVTDEFPQEIKDIAINALKVIPNFPNGGVDVMVDYSKPIDQAAKVIELTPVPQIGSLVFPMKGKARDIPAAIIDEYFPETKHLKNTNPNIYFYLPEILKPLNSKEADEIKVISCPNDIEERLQFIVKGNLNKHTYHRQIRKLALENNLHGYSKQLESNTIQVAVAGSEQNVALFMEKCERNLFKVAYEIISKEKWEDFIRVGFEIKPIKVKQKTKLKKHKKHKKLNFFQKVKRKLFN